MFLLVHATGFWPTPWLDTLGASLKVGLKHCGVARLYKYGVTSVCVYLHVVVSCFTINTGMKLQPANIVWWFVSHGVCIDNELY